MLSIEAFVEKAAEDGAFAFDVEHPPGLIPTSEKFRLCGCSFATADSVMYLTNPASISKLCKILFRITSVDAVAYNGKYDLKCLLGAGLVDSEEFPKSFVDPMIGVNLLDDNRRPNQLGLKVVMKDFFDVDMMTFTEAWKHGETSEEFVEYAKNDARQEHFLWGKVREKLELQELTPIFRKVLCPASLVFADMEYVGMRWDIKKARELLRGFQLVRSKMEEEILREIGNLNLNSGDQLAKRLFNELGYSTKGIELTKSGKRYSVDEKAMDTLAGKYPICAKIKTYRTANKMINTYVEPITRQALQDSCERIHPTFWLVSATGRTRCEKPNLQNIPAWVIKAKAFKGLSIRDAFIPRDGTKLLVADFSQIELRLIAHITKDPIFLESYLTWQCTKCKNTGASTEILHECPNCGMFENEDILKDSKVEGFWHGQDLHQRTCDEVPATHDRQGAKTANFALVYYATPVKMHYEYPKLSLAQWREVHYQYFEVYRGVRAWHTRMQAALYESGIVRDVFGRKRRIRKMDIQKNPKHALNMFINFSPQASACGMMELAMVKLREKCIDQGNWLRDIWPVNMVHDEIVVEASVDRLEYYKDMLTDVMENCVKIRVPLRADVKALDTWGAAKT